jgi:Ala-tRNA(Pro) deacylase
MSTPRHISQATDLVCRYLENHGVEYELVQHEAAFSASREAEVAGVLPHHAVKTLALRDGEAYRLAVIPASRRLDLELARKALNASANLRLASESELARDFAVFEVGALPPFGPLLPAPEVVDPRVVEQHRILCSSGDHSHSLLIDPHEIVRLARPRVADICESAIWHGAPLERY